MSKYAFGVDVGGTTCKLGLFEIDGTLLDKWEIPTRTENCGGSILEDIACAIEGKLKEKNLAREAVLGVGLGVPGPVLEDGTVKKCVNLGWDIINASHLLGGRLNIPVKVGNDANVAALGEMWQGGGKGYQNVVMLTLGTGVGGGIVIGGKVLAGTNGAAGEIGHLKMRDDEREPCSCGGYGCLEQYASATGIVRRARERLECDGAPTGLRDLPELSAKTIAEAAGVKDAVALELIEELGRMLGTAIANIACIVDPQMVVIGGGVSKAGAILLNAVEKGFQNKAFHACTKTKFSLAELENDAGMYGCVKLLLDT